MGLKNQTAPSGWQNSGYESTGASPLNVVAPAFLALLVPLSTGGSRNNDWIRARDAQSFVGHHRHTEEVAQTAPISLGSELDLIKSTLGLSISDVAKCLGVSRPTIYNWKAGTAIKDANAARFQNLLDAAIALKGAGVTPLALRRKLPGGKTVVETIAMGGNGSLAVLTLLDMLRGEEEARSILSKRFAGRSGQATSAIESTTLRDEE